MEILVALRNCGRLALFLCASTTVAISAAAQPAAPEPANAPPAPPIIRPYALIKPRAVFAASPVESFSQPNASAATAAGNPVLSAIPDEASLTFQVAQSRLGVWFAEGLPVRGQLELDFINFAVSSPTVASVPRLRIAKIEWALSESTLLMAGQDWDLYAPVNFHTLNFVANAFQAGNTGFMRQQAKLIWHNDNLEVAGAIGLAGINAGAKALMPEYNLLPTIAARAALLLGPTGRIGVNLIGTQWTYGAKTATERDAIAGSAGIYGDLTPVKPFNIRFEVYAGQNMATLGLLALGAGNVTDDIQEIGGALSAKFGFTDNHAIYGLFGLAKVLNDDKVVPSYTYPTVVEGMMPAESTAALVAGNPGITQNLTARLGYEYRHDKSIAFMLEGFMFNTKHVLNATYDADLEDNPTAVGAELGLVFTL